MPLGLILLMFLKFPGCWLYCLQGRCFSMKEIAYYTIFENEGRGLLKIKLLAVIQSGSFSA